MTNKFKKVALMLALGAGFVIAPGMSTLSTAQAQDWRRNDRNRNGVVDRYERDRNRNGIIDGYERRGYGLDRNRNGVDDRYENGRYNGYGNSGYGYNSAQYQEGYRDGLDRGMKDARTDRAMDPNNSSHYRSGSQAYREGFQRGFYESYRRYSYRGW